MLYMRVIPEIPVILGHYGRNLYYGKSNSPLEAKNPHLSLKIEEMGND